MALFDATPTDAVPTVWQRALGPKTIEIILWVAAATVSLSIYYKALAARAVAISNAIAEYRLLKQVPEDVPLSAVPGFVTEKISNPSLTPVIFAVAFLLIPILWKLIFGALPFEMLRSITLGRNRIFIDVPSDTLPSSESSFESRDGIQTSDTLAYLRSRARASRQIAEKLYLRAGVYLLIGVLVAFSGLAFFYYQQAQQIPLAQSLVASSKFDVEQAPKQPTAHESTSSLQDNLLRTLPRFGILFFIETIAFFFLRQYRTAMDEYRYFEAIKRRREENFVLLCLLASEKPLDLTKFPQQASFYSDVAALAQGQTTELLESRKLTRDETALLEKVVDAITKIKP